MAGAPLTPRPRDPNPGAEDPQTHLAWGRRGVRPQGDTWGHLGPVLGGGEKVLECGGAQRHWHPRTPQAELGTGGWLVIEEMSLSLCALRRAGSGPAALCRQCWAVPSHAGLCRAMPGCAEPCQQRQAVLSCAGNARLC